MTVVGELLEEPEEIRDHQIADVHAVHVRVGGEDDLLVAQALGVVLGERCNREGDFVQPFEKPAFCLRKRVCPWI